MLAKSHRLARRSDLQSVLRGGKKISNDFFILRSRPNNLTNPRFAVIVANKVSKRATKRNLLKRRTRAIIKNILPEIKGNFDFIITVLSPTINQSYQEMNGCLLALLKKINLI